MKIRGNLVGTTQKPEKVLIKATDLTEEQKVQVRENIAACHKDDSRIGTDVWSSKNTIDKLCPSFTASGGVVTCEPVEGYPLEVTASPEATQIVRCGKNLSDFKQGVGEVHFTASSGADTMKYGYAFRLPAGTYTAHAEPVVSKDKEQFVYCIANDANGNYINLADYLISGGTSTYLRQGTVCTPRTFTFDKNVVLYVYQGGTVDKGTAQAWLVYDNNIQIEVGTVKTDYEPYRGETFTVGAEMPSLAGTNYLYADAGNITVTGRLYPDKSIINKPSATITNKVLIVE